MQLTQGAGALASYWLRASDRLEEEVTKTWDKITKREKFERDLLLEAERQRRAFEATMSAEELRRMKFQEEKRRLQAKLQGLGINVTDEDMDNEDEKANDPVEHGRAANLSQTDSRRRFLEMYHSCWHILVGISSLQVMSGANKITFNFGGLDIFEVSSVPPKSFMFTVTVK